MPSFSYQIHLQLCREKIRFNLEYHPKCQNCLMMMMMHTHQNPTSNCAWKNVQSWKPKKSLVSELSGAHCAMYLLGGYKETKWGKKSHHPHVSWAFRNCQMHIVHCCFCEGIPEIRWGKKSLHVFPEQKCSGKIMMIHYKIIGYYHRRSPFTLWFLVSGIHELRHSSILQTHHAIW